MTTNSVADNESWTYKPSDAVSVKLHLFLVKHNFSCSHDGRIQMKVWEEKEKKINQDNKSKNPETLESDGPWDFQCVYF